MYRHIDTPYIGIAHYRRRLDLTDAQYNEFMDNDVDIITSVPHKLNESIEEQYKALCYSYDWEVFKGVLRRLDPSNYQFYLSCLNRNDMHLCNINVFKSELFKELCEWAFPICDEFAKLCHEKTDVYQHRDVSFIMERLSHLFVMLKAKEGKNIIEADMVKFDSFEWDAYDECDYTDSDEVYAICNRLYKENRIIRCKYVMGYALRNGLEKDHRLRSFAEILSASIEERNNLPMTMHEYLPKEFRSSLDILIPIWDGLKKISRLYNQNDDETIKQKFREYVSMTHFSNEAFRVAVSG